MAGKLLIAALALAALAAAAIPDDASAGGWRGRPADVVLLPGWGYYSYPWGYVIPTAPYAYPVVYNCLHRYAVPRRRGVWRGAKPGCASPHQSAVPFEDAIGAKRGAG
jgi:hypothetical protein